MACEEEANQQKTGGAVSRAYYNENNGFCADWLENLIGAGLIAPGDVDRRSIVDVRPDDIRSYVQCHWFAGIGGWPLALRMAGISDDRPLWTGSCPCQRFSSAARGKNNADDLWPRWLPLIAASRPREIFGEQVAHRSDWIDRACDDLEALDYEIGAAVLTACGVGQDHARPRFYFVGHTDRDGQSGVRLDGEVAWMRRHRSDAGSMVPTNGVPGRMAQLGAFGNAIVVTLAAQFIAAYLDLEQAAEAMAGR